MIYNYRWTKNQKKFTASKIKIYSLQRLKTHLNLLYFISMFTSPSVKVPTKY